VRSKTISRRRYERTLERLAEKGRGVRTVTVPHATGPIAARSVGLLRELDAELRRATGDQKSLDDVVRALVASREPISLAHFRAVAEGVAGVPLAAFFDRRELAPTN
jgi:hypothetical protein